MQTRHKILVGPFMEKVLPMEHVMNVTSSLLRRLLRNKTPKTFKNCKEAVLPLWLWVSVKHLGDILIVTDGI